MPRSGWRKSESDRRLSDLVSVGLVTRVFPADVVDRVIADAGRTQLRNRSLPARVVAYFSIGMALYSEGSYEDVFAQFGRAPGPWARGQGHAPVRTRQFEGHRRFEQHVGTLAKSSPRRRFALTLPPTALLFAAFIVGGIRYTQHLIA